MLQLEAHVTSSYCTYSKHKLHPHRLTVYLSVLPNTTQTFSTFYAPETPALIFPCWTPAWSETPQFLCWDCQPLLCFPVNVNRQLVTVHVGSHTWDCQPLIQGKITWYTWCWFTLQCIGILWRSSAFECGSLFCLLWCTPWPDSHSWQLFYSIPLMYRCC